MNRFRGSLVIGALILITSIFIFSTMGYLKLPIGTIVDILLNRGEVPEAHSFIVKNVRVPRILVSMIVGANLSISGLLFQGVLLNPLADPYTLGISAGASFGAALSIILGFTFFGVFTTPLLAFIFALLCLFIVLKMATFGGRINSLSLILSGVIIGSFFSAGLSFTKYIAGDDVSSIIFWLMGSFSSKTWLEVGVISIVTSLGMAVSLYYSEELNILSLGEKNAIVMGIDTDKIRRILLVTASIMSAATVSICGIIGFIGLIIPHLMRFLIGTNNRRLIILSSIWGAIILSTADNTVRAILPNEIPIGVVTSLLGAPFFALIFRKKLGGGRL